MDAYHRGEQEAKGPGEGSIRSARPEGAVSQAAPGLRGDGDEGPGEAERTEVWLCPSSRQHDATWYDFGEGELVLEKGLDLCC